MKRALILLLASVAAVLALSGKAFASPEQDFWTWFNQNEPALFDFEKNQTQVFKDLSDQMKKINPDLTFEFGPKENGKRDFVISAGGIKSSFPAVIALYDTAPKLEHWNFIKFRPRREFADNSLKLDGIEVWAKDISFALTPQGSKVGLTLYMKGYTATPDKTYEQIAYLMLDTALGEYDVETKVGATSIKDTHADDQVKKLPLKGLPGAVDSYIQSTPNH